MTTGNKKYISVVVALTIFILSALGLRLWASHRATQVEGPAIVRQGPDGLVYIVNDTKLYLHDSNGDLVDIISLDRFGLERAKGDFWIFNNGDLLLRRETNKRLSCRRELETFFRTGSSKQDTFDSGEGILQRCNRNSYECIVFGSGHDAFNKIGPFKFFINEEKGELYIADTRAHQLLLYDLNGNLKRKSDIRFHYPNGIVGAGDGLLYVADTNHHRIAAVNPDYSTFGRVEHEFSIINTVGPPEKVWPFALGQDRDGRWWVINAGNEMRYGDLMIYDRSGKVFKHVELPENAEPSSIAILNDRVLVTDPSLMRVYSVALNGEVQDNFGSLLFKLDCSEKLREKNLFASLSSIMLYLVLTGAIAAIIVAWKAQTSLALESKQNAQQLVDKENDATSESSNRQADSAEVDDAGSASVSRLPASQGWAWLSDALRIVKNSSRIYVVFFLVGLLRWQGILKIPEIGYLALLLVSPMIDGILMVLSRMIAENGKVDVRNIKIRPHIVDLLFTGGVYCLVLALSVVIVQLITGKSMFALLMLGKSEEIGRLVSQADVPLLMGALFLAFILLCLFAATWFASPLIVFKGFSYKKAMALSLKSVVLNYRAFILYTIVLCGFFLVFGFAMLVVPGIIFIPLGLANFVKPMSTIMSLLFWPILAPIITLSVYTSYVRVFEAKPEIVS